MNIITSDVGGNISTDGVTVSSSAVGIEFTTHITFGNVDLCEISPTERVSAVSSLTLIPFQLRKEDEGT